MSRLGLIIQREYMQIVAKKSFIFTTILLPILMVALVAILPAFLANVKSDEKKNVAIIDNNPGAVYAAAIQDTEAYHFIKVNQSIEGTELYSYFQNEKEGQGLNAIVQIPADLSTSTTFYVYSDQAINSTLERDIKNALRPMLEQERIQSYGIDSLADIRQTL